ncbi:MAG TPA: ribosomal protein S18-alanine N-acetyltransferase [Thermoanaerobaculia bacterium]|nr:ribosomal protein S18-alanine N-acetyltransferase [Thermoanaerobaculia bacterium]
MSDPGEIAIRPALDDDLAGIFALERAGFPDPWPVELLASELRHPDSFLLVACAGESAPLGYASFRTAVDEAELLRLAVEPAVRKRGLGRRLLEAGCARLGERGFVRCFLEVRDENRPAIALYESSGFRLAGRRKGYYRDGMDALVYLRAIAAPPP